MFEINNELGKINFLDNVIYKICQDAADQTGYARVQNYKGRYTAKKPGLLNAFSQTEEENDAVEILETDLGLAIKIYVVVKFGVSISTVANSIIDYVYEQLQTAFDVRPAAVKVVVTGIASKTIAKRDLEFVR